MINEEVGFDDFFIVIGVWDIVVYIKVKGGGKIIVFWC